MKFKASYCKDGIWYTVSRKQELVHHLFRIGYTEYNGITIYEVILWKFMIQWSFV